jgi:hypothetical protein
MKKYVGIALLLTFMACTNSGQKVPGSADSSVKAGKVVAPANGAEFADPKAENIYREYIILKNALVASNAKAAQTSSFELSKRLRAFEGCENTALITDKMAGTEDLKLQRKEFTALSSDVIALFKHADIKKGSVFIQHCPMANNGDGGDWMSAEKRIRNPYYGDEMLECGAILQEFKAKK